MLIFGSIATPQEVLISDLRPLGSFFSKMDFTALTNAGEAVKRLDFDDMILFPPGQASMRPRR
jgi:hypothetical protein